MQDFSIESTLKEQISIAPKKHFSARTHLADPAEYQHLWQWSKDDPDDFWAQQALTYLNWKRPFQKTRSSAGWDAQWFVDGTLNACENVLDRHLDSQGDRAAIIWEGEPGDKRQVTYRELHADVCQMANGLKELGVAPGQVVAIHMPMVIELTTAVLACARIGAVHSVIFAGFSAEAIAKRIQDAQAQVVITADGLYRKGKELALKDQVDEAVARCKAVKHVIVLKRTEQNIHWYEGRDIWWHELVAKQSVQCAAYEAASGDPLFILYTSGSTGSPKGIVHSTAGYLLQAALSSKYVFDLQSDDLFWCTADIGWITGHSYVIYGPLLMGSTILMYEGAPNTPDWGRFWQLIETYQVTKFYTAPTAIRAFMQQGDKWPDKYDLSSLKLLGTVGEPINPKVWIWLHDVIGQKQCPVVDTWWQTETGSIMITTLPGAMAAKPGAAGLPFFGVDCDVVDMDGRSVPVNSGGLLVMRQPWPGMFRTIWNDHQRYIKQYFETIPGCYLAGDAVRCDEDGYFWILGRIDDVINVSGHRLSTMEIESALVSHHQVSEAAVVGVPDELTGEAISCFVVLNHSDVERDDINEELTKHVVHEIGALARPTKIRVAPALPKTRSGKIMRRILRDIASGRVVGGDLTTLEDVTTIERLCIDVRDGSSQPS